MTSTQTDSRNLIARIRVVRGSTPLFDGARRGGRLLVGGTEIDPVPLRGKPCVQIVEGPEVVFRLGGANLADQLLRVGLLSTLDFTT